MRIRLKPLHAMKLNEIAEATELSVTQVVVCLINTEHIQLKARKEAKGEHNKWRENHEVS